MPKSKPPLRKPPVDLNKLDQFASAADLSQEETLPQVAQERDIPRTLYPWEEPGVRSDVVKGMGVPLSEPYLFKLRFIAEHTKWSQRKFCQAKLEEEIDKEIEAILRGVKVQSGLV